MGAGQSTSGGRPSPRSNPHIRERGDGREASFGLVGNFWEDDEEGDGDHGLLKVTHEETSDYHRRLQELRAKHPRSDAEVATHVVKLRGDPWVRSVDTQARAKAHTTALRHGAANGSARDRMAELRAEHAKRLVEWETDQRRTCCQCKELIANERAATVENPLTLEFEYCHQACHTDWISAHAPICAYEGCDHKVMPIEGRFSGSKTTTPAGIVHAECYEAWVQSMAERCALCEERLSGGFEVSADGKKVHADCKSKYNHSRGLLCLHCQEVFEEQMPEHAPTVVSHRVKFEHGWTHKGVCAVAYLRETAERCLHCKQAIMADGAGSQLEYGGLDEISYLQLKEGKIHRKCYGEYRKNTDLTCAVCSAPFDRGKFYAVIDSRLHSPRTQRARRGSASAEMQLVHAKCRNAYCEQHGSVSFKMMTSTR